MFRYSVNFLTFMSLCLLYVVISCNAQIKEVGCSGDDAQEFCDNGAQIVFYGKNFIPLKEREEFNLSENPKISMLVTSSSKTHLDGTLYYDKNTIFDGPYSVNPHLTKDNSSDWNGTLLLGNFWGSYPMQYYNTPTPPKDAEVTGRISNGLYNGSPIDILGTFNKNKQYKVWFYFTEEHIILHQTPTCDNVTVTETKLMCTVNHVLQVGKQFKFIVQEVETFYYVRVAKMIEPIVSVNTPSIQEPIPQSLPVITNANSMCVLVSAACVDNAIITFYGLQFVSNATDEYKVNIEDINNAGCKVSRTTNTSLSCTLFGVNGKKGMFTMTIQIKDLNGMWSSTKRDIGSLVLGAGKEASGYSLNYIKPPTVIHSTTTKSATVTTALTIVFAILFAVVLIILLVIFLRFKMISRSMWSTIKKQLQDTQVEELRPRTAVRVKNEAMN